MITGKELLKVYETILKSPGMNEPVKFAVKISRRDVLLLCQLIERGLVAEDAKAFIPSDAVEQLRALSDEFLSKGAFSQEFIASFKELTAVKQQA
jgi:hypothetical protein